jgi:hypothetical protein
MKIAQDVRQRDTLVFIQGCVRNRRSLDPRHNAPRPGISASCHTGRQGRRHRKGDVPRSDCKPALFIDNQLHTRRTTRQADSERLAKPECEIVPSLGGKGHGQVRILRMLVGDKYANERLAHRDFGIRSSRHGAS